jgi:Amt family ammonium transporter
MSPPAAPPPDTALGLVWVIVTGAMVMFMQVGFALVETGFTRAKNAVNTMAMNLLIYPISVIGYWAVGFGVMYGGVAGWPALGSLAVTHRELGFHVGAAELGLLGAAKFVLFDVAADPAHLAMFLFASVFLDTAATIPTGAMAERWKFSAFIAYGFFMSMILYPLYGNWVWGGGWLSQLGASFALGHGHVDFAGSSVVHMTGGMTALAGALVLGPRLGKFRRDGTVGVMPGHNLPMTVIGTGILAFGWFGFNAGGTLTGADPRIALIAANTMLSSSAGALTALFYVWQDQHRPDIGMACNGLLAGLVAITASCAFVSPAAAVLIGVVAGLLVVWVVALLERMFRVDDPVGAIAVHGAAGAWGALAVGLFADGTYGVGWNGVPGPVRGLLFGDPGQLVAQLVIERTMCNRVTPEAERDGLDAQEMGSEAYPD